jgi:hypothetical protein
MTTVRAGFHALLLSLVLVASASPAQAQTAGEAFLAAQAVDNATGLAIGAKWEEFAAATSSSEKSTLLLELESGLDLAIARAEADLATADPCWSMWADAVVHQWNGYAAGLVVYKETGTGDFADGNTWAALVDNVKFVELLQEDCGSPS